MGKLGTLEGQKHTPMRSNINMLYNSIPYRRHRGYKSVSRYIKQLDEIDWHSWTAAP